MRVVYGMLFLVILITVSTGVAWAGGHKDSVPPSEVFMGHGGGHSAPPAMFGKILSMILESAGDAIEVDGASNFSPLSIEGDANSDNSVVNIDEINISFDIGDISLINTRDVALVGPRGSINEPVGPPMAMMTPPFMHWKDRPGKPHGDGPHGMRPELMEMMAGIPPDVDPEFIEFIMLVGRLAWEHPEFRERLEKMVMKAEENMGDRPRR